MRRPNVSTLFDKVPMPSVTLVVVETLDHELMRVAVEDAVGKADFGEILIFSNESYWHFERPIDYRLVEVENWPSKLDWCRFMWHGVPQYVHTRHMLLMQWDAGIWDTSMWREEFLSYDYVGSPWWYKTKNVGNSGFALKSTRLARYMRDNRGKFPLDVDIEDDQLCRKYRPELEKIGFTWAPDAIAHDFAFECARPSETSRHFGYHAMFNWPYVLDRDDLMRRLELATRSQYIRESYMMKNFCKQHPEIVKDLLGREATLQAAE